MADFLGWRVLETVSDMTSKLSRNCSVRRILIMSSIIIHTMVVGKVDAIDTFLLLFMSCSFSRWLDALFSLSGASVRQGRQSLEFTITIYGNGYATVVRRSTASPRLSSLPLLHGLLSMVFVLTFDRQVT